MIYDPSKQVTAVLFLSKWRVIFCYCVCGGTFFLEGIFLVLSLVNLKKHHDKGEDKRDVSIIIH